MKHPLAVVLLVFASSTFALGQSQTPAQETNPQTVEQLAAKAELNEAARAYVAGRFAEAQRHSELASQIDPSNKIAPIFIARSLHAQYRPGVESPENDRIAREAIVAYQRILLRTPDDDEAYKAIATLYGQVGENELQYSWILQRALNGGVSEVKRAEAYTILASKDWNCSYTITEQPENKQVARTRKGVSVIVYRMPTDRREFDKAQQCVTHGMEMVETAITLEPENDVAWSFKSNLLIEMAKVSEMAGDRKLRNEFHRQANEAVERTNELTHKRQVEMTEVAP